VTYKVEFDHFEGNKWDPSQDVYCIMNSKNEKSYITQEHMAGAAYSTLSFDNIDIANDKRDYAMSNAKALLLKSGFQDADIDIKSNGNSSGFSVKIKNAQDGDMLRFVSALSTDFVSNKETYYAVLAPEVTTKIIEAEIVKMSTIAEQANALAIDMRTESAQEAMIYGRTNGVSTISASFLGGTLSLDESANSAFDGEKNTVEMQTSLSTLPHMTAFIAKSLKEGGLNVAYAKDGFIAVMAPADQVASTLADKKILPTWAATQIKDTALTAHPDQAAVNKKVADYGRQFVAEIKASAPTPTKMKMG
jgi:hypothetical protein